MVALVENSKIAGMTELHNCLEMNFDMYDWIANFNADVNRLT